MQFLQSLFRSSGSSDISCLLGDLHTTVRALDLLLTDLDMSIALASHRASHVLPAIWARLPAFHRPPDSAHTVFLWPVNVGASASVSGEQPCFKLHIIFGQGRFGFGSRIGENTHLSLRRRKLDPMVILLRYGYNLDLISVSVLQTPTALDVSLANLSISTARRPIFTASVVASIDVVPTTWTARATAHFASDSAHQGII